MDVTVDAVPEIRAHVGIYADIVARIIALPKGQSLKIGCRDYDEIKKVRHGIRETGKKLNRNIRTYRRDNFFWAWDITPK